MEKECSLKELAKHTIRLGLFEYLMGETDVEFGSQFLSCYNQGQAIPEKLKNEAYNKIDKLTKNLILSIKNMLETNAAKTLFKFEIKYVNNYFWEKHYKDIRYRAEYYLRLALILKALKETKNILKAEKLLDSLGLDYIWSNSVLEGACAYLQADNFQLELPDADEVFTFKKDWQNQNNEN